MDNTLLATKLHIPPPCQILVLRPRLTATLSKALTSSLSSYLLQLVMEKPLWLAAGCAKPISLQPGFHWTKAITIPFASYNTSLQL